MRKVIYAISTLFASFVISAALVNAAHAIEVPDQNCEVFSRSYSVGADSVTANFEVKKISGEGTCSKQVTVAAWDAPNGVDGVPFNQQKFVDSKSGTFAVGFHSLTVKKPACFYQVDVLRGLSPFGPSGNTNDYQDWQYVSSAHGGTECKPTPPPTPVTPVAPVAPVSKASLPTTGIESVFGGIFGSTALATGSYAYLRSRKTSKNSRPINKNR